VGALQVLLEAGIRPQLLVGSSAGALNAAFLATDPTPVGADRLGDLWRQVTKEDIYPGGLFRAVWHLLRCRDSLYSSKPFRAFLEVHIPREMRLFRQLPVALYVTAADLSTGRLYLFGEDPQESMLDALMASTAAPPLHAPVAYRGRLLVDGAVAANLPVGVALEKGATEVYALDVWGQPPRNARRWSLPEVATWSIRALMHQQWERELARCALHPEVRLYHLPLSSEGLPAFDDFSQATALIAAGRVQAEAYLAAQGLPRPEREGVHAPRWRHAFPLEEVRQEIERLSAAVAAHTHRPEAPNAALTSGAPPGGSPDGHAIRETRDSGRP
ncbi:MAG TPA: hypothetical protein DEP84_22840, partial [Chloroflexi bacterium]|nr:hypothetical protein [Chloroflexota bacterium]